MQSTLIGLQPRAKKTNSEEIAIVLLTAASLLMMGKKFFAHRNTLYHSNSGATTKGGSTGSRSGIGHLRSRHNGHELSSNFTGKPECDGVYGFFKPK